MRHLVPCLLAGILGAADHELVPFVLPWNDASPSIVSLRQAGDPPAGAGGRVQVGADGHLMAGGKRIRFLGTNFSFNASLPTPEQSEGVAARLAKFGVNIVRIHHMDSQPWPRGIRAAKAGTRELEPEAQRRLDHLFAALKKHGIYTNLNLLVGRPFTADDGLPADIGKLGWKDRAIPAFFFAPMIALQKEYARQLLTRRNEVTGTVWAEDPALAFVEIHNENGLFQAWHGGDLDTLPAAFADDLKRQWNTWLKARHQSTAALARAWGAQAEPLGPELLKNAGWQAGFDGWNLERHGGAQAVTAQVDDAPATPGTKALRLTIDKPGAENWHVQINQGRLALQAGGAYTVEVWLKADADRTVDVGVGMAHAPWGNLGLAARAAVGRDWKRFRYAFVANQADDNARLNLTGFGRAAGTVWLAGVSLKPGGITGVLDGERIEDGSMPTIPRDQTGSRTPAAQRDWVRFLWETEDRYWQGMRRFLVDELQVQAPVMGTIIRCSTHNLQARLDGVDTHEYWNHPHFPNKPWDSEDWIVDNKAMVNAPDGGVLNGIAVRRVLGKPHSVTEYNHPAPNPYCAEGFLLLAAYAAFHDWDAIYPYSYSHGTFDSQRIDGFFDICQHPTKMASLIPAHALFNRGDVRPARQAVVVALDQEREIDLLRTSRAWNLLDEKDLGIPGGTMLTHRVAVAVQGSAVPAGSLAPAPIAPADNRFVSDTGELVWDRSDPGRGVVTVDAARSKAVVGFAAGRTFTLGSVTIVPGPTRDDGFSCITATVLGDGPAFTEPGPRRILITTLGAAENVGMQWKDGRRTSVGRNWGTAPSVVEVVAATVTLPWPAERVQVWALDPCAQRGAPVTVQAVGGKAVVTLGGAAKTLWYEVAVR